MIVTCPLPAVTTDWQGGQISLELNPEERLNGDLKHAIETKAPVRTQAKLKLAASEHMTKLEQSARTGQEFPSKPPASNMPIENSNFN